MNLHTNQHQAFSDSDRAEHNKKRSYYTSFLRKKNIQLVNAINEHCATKYPAELAAKEAQPHYWDSPEVSEAQDEKETTNFEYLQNLKRRLWFSANGDLSLYRGFQDGAVSFMGAIDSGHKLDALSNSRRSKQLRKKYWDYLSENSKTNYIGTYNEKVLTPEYKWFECKKEADQFVKLGEINKFQETEEYERLIATGLEGARLTKAMKQKKVKQFKTEAVPRYFNILDNCNFLHLVLTLPHTNNGYNGKRFYARELMEKFNLLRKYPFFKERVFGGEYSCEIVKKHDNGLHIHLHVMLVVHNEKRVRNKLIPEIMKVWNSLTATDKKPLSDGQKEYLQTLTLKDEKNQLYKVFSEKEIQKFNGSGATHISLESLYTVTEQRQSKYSKKLDCGKWKNYVSAPNPADREADPETYARALNNLLSGVMECLKYHFEPFALENENGFDMELVDEILPLIHNLPLYRKFGAFHGVKELNVNHKSTKEQAAEIVEENAADEVTHPETGEIVPRSQYRYFTCDPCYAFHDFDENKKIKIAERRRNYIEDEGQSENLQSILEKMIRLSMKPETAIELKIEE